MKIVKDQLPISELQEMAKNMHGDFVKVIIDIEKEIMAIDAPMHSDLLEFLIKEENSEPKNLWGINIHPDKKDNDFIEFDSMMNFKPGFGNRTMGIESEEIRNKIIDIINKLVKK